MNKMREGGGARLSNDQLSFLVYSRDFTDGMDGMEGEVRVPVRMGMGMRCGGQGQGVKEYGRIWLFKRGM